MFVWSVCVADFCSCELCISSFVCVCDIRVQAYPYT
jgi:hypothetical protein